MLEPVQLRRCLRVLHRGEESPRHQAIRALKSYGEAEWAAAPVELVHAIVEALQHQVVNGTRRMFTRQEVVTILGNMGSRAAPAIPWLIEMLADGVPDGTREAAAATLGRIGKVARPAVEALVALLTDRRAALAVQAARALGNIGCADQKVRAGLAALWLSPDQPRHVRIQVATVLCKLKIQNTGVLPFLTETLAMSQDAAVRRAAAEALAWCSPDDKDVVPMLLLAAGNDKDVKLSEVAAAALARLRVSHEGAVRLCLEQVRDSAQAEAALRTSGPRAVPALIEALGSKEPVVREKAARILGGAGESAQDAVAALARALRDRHVRVRLAAAKALWLITRRTAEIVPVLADLLESDGADVEAGEPRRQFLQTVIEALGRIGPPAAAAVPALLAKTRDRSCAVRESAAGALRRITPAPQTRVHAGCEARGAGGA